MDTDLTAVIVDFDAVLDMRAMLVRLVNEQIKNRSHLSPEIRRHEETTNDGRKLVVFFPNRLETLVRMSTKSCYGLGQGDNVNGDNGAQELDQGRQMEENGVSGDCTSGAWCENELYFVAFVGFKKPSLSNEDLPIKVWDADEGLKRDMSSIPEILAYVSCERRCGGDWSNLVIFTARNVVEKWQESPLHTYLVNEFSPLFYSKVRIHRGVLMNGLRSDAFCLERTLFLNYTNMTASQESQRHVKYWNNSEHSSPVEWVTLKA